jgi:hypothetical protein
VEVHHPYYLPLQELGGVYPVADGHRLDSAALEPFVASLQSDYYLLDTNRQQGAQK